VRLGRLLLQVFEELLLVVEHRHRRADLAVCLLQLLRKQLQRVAVLQQLLSIGVQRLVVDHIVRVVFVRVFFMIGKEARCCIRIGLVDRRRAVDLGILRLL